MTTKITITTPTGKNGSALMKRLLDAADENALEIVLLAHDPEKLREFTERGARVEKGSLDDAAFVPRATEGMDALFWLTPQNFKPGEGVTPEIPVDAPDGGSGSSCRTSATAEAAAAWATCAERPFRPSGFPFEVACQIDVSAITTRVHVSPVADDRDGGLVP